MKRIRADIIDVIIETLERVLSMLITASRYLDIKRLEMSNFLVLCSDKVIPEAFWKEHRYEGDGYCGRYSSSFAECNSKAFGINEPELIKYAYKLESPIYFELEDETKKAKDIYTETKKLLLWLYNLINELIDESYVIKLIKVNNGNDDDAVTYEQNIDVSFLLQEVVVFDSYVIYRIHK